MTITKFAQEVGKDVKALQAKDIDLENRLQAVENKPVQTIDTNALKNEIKAEIIGGASSDYDTLKEMADYIEQDKGAGVAMATALGNRLRVDESQSLSEVQQKTARENLGLGDDYLTIYNQAKA